MSNKLSPLSGPVDASGEPAYWCCKLCKCLWRDNHDGTVSLASAKQTSCQTCEMEPSHVACEPLFLRSILVDRDAEVRREMRAYLDTFTIHGDNIGGIRRMLFMPFDSQWNGWVRDDTAAREVSATDLKSAATAVPSSPAQPTTGNLSTMGIGPWATPRPGIHAEDRCDCGQPIAGCCIDCAVADYQASNPTCATCCPIRPSALPPSSPVADSPTTDEETDEEEVPHVFEPRTHSPSHNEQDIWCKHCEYHRDYQIHVASAPSPSAGAAKDKE